MKRRRKLYLVGQDPADVFNDLEQLRTDMAAPLRRGRATATFARVPHDAALQLYRRGISGAAWAVLIELDRLVLKNGGQNPVRLWSSRLREVGMTRWRRQRALQQLEAAGAVRVEQRGKGRSPWVMHLWYPERG